MDHYDYNTLECRYKAARRQLEEFRSGEKYRQLQELREKDAAYYNRIIHDLEVSLGRAHRETVEVRNMWFEVFDELEDEYRKKYETQERRIHELEDCILKKEKARNDALDKVTEWRHKYYETATELEDEKDKNQKLHAQINRDFENSSTPSSGARTQKKIPNGREKTGKKPGAQPGHKGHGRKRQTPTTTMTLPPPEDVMNDPDFKKTGKKKIRQMVSIRMCLVVTELIADVYYNSKTNEEVYAAFPEGYVNDVNYDGSVRAFLYMLNNDCNVSIDRSRRFLSDLTGGRLNISKGMINSLSEEFAAKSKPEIDELGKDLLLIPVMHTDNTNASVDGESGFVFVCAAPDGRAVYSYNKHKGHEGVKSTIVSDYQGILVHDHDTTFYSYGSDHQECSAHILRYLKDSIDNEPGRTWSTDMRALIQEMIHYRNSIPDGEEPDEQKVAAFEKRYDAAIAKAKEEYDEVPPGRYYKDGYNLYRRMEKYRDNHLLFLHDIRVPATNNEAERLLRSYKRKQAQAVTFRSEDSINDLCAGMSMLVLIRQDKNANVFERVTDIFRSERPGFEKKTGSSDS